MSTMYECEPTDLAIFDNAPHRFVADIDIKATPERIFESFENEHDWTIWAAPIQKVEWTSPKPFGLGTTRTVYMSGNMVGEEEFIAWEPGKRMAFKFTRASMDAVKRFAEDYHVTDNGDGTVNVKWIMAMDASGINHVFLELFGWVMARMNRSFLKKFKKHIEGTL